MSEYTVDLVEKAAVRSLAHGGVAPTRLWTADELRRRTQEDFTVQVDPSGEAADGTVKDQNMVTHHGAYSSLYEALKALPDTIAHAVVLELSDGVHLLTDDVLREFSRFQWGFSKTESIAPVYGTLTIKSKNGLVIADGTAEMDVTSSTGAAGGHAVTLDSDPGLDADDFQDYLLYVTAGTGAGEYKHIRAHTTTNFDVAGAYASDLDGTSKVEIRKPAAELQLVSDFPAWVMQRTLEKGGVILDTVDVTPGGSGLGIMFCSASVLLQGGTRIIDLVLWFKEHCKIGHKTSAIVSDGAGAALMSFRSGSYIRTFSGTSEPLFMRASQIATAINFSNKGSTGPAVGGAGYLFGGQQFDGFDGKLFTIEGPQSTLFLAQSGGVGLQCDSNPTHAVELKNGATVIVESLSDLDSDLAGDTEDILLDGNATGWSDVDGDANDISTGVLGSSVFQEA